MKYFYFLLITALLLIAGCTTDVSYQEPSGRRLRTITEEKFPDETMIVGVSCGLWAFEDGRGDIVDYEFNLSGFNSSQLCCVNMGW